MPASNFVLFGVETAFSCGGKVEILQSCPKSMPFFCSRKKKGFQKKRKGKKEGRENRILA